MTGQAPPIPALESLLVISDGGRSAVVYLVDETTVLKLARDAVFAPGFEREALALAAAGRVPGLAPAFRGTVTVDGRPGLLVERVEGIDLLKEVEKKPWRTWRVGRELAEQHVRLSSIVAPPEMETAKARIRHRLGSDAIPEELRRRALAELELVPDGDSVCHVDFHPGNLMRTENGELKVIDFANACAGDSAWDHAATLSLLELGAPPPSIPIWMRLLIGLLRRVVLTGYKRRYRQLRPVDEENLRRWQAIFLIQRLDDRIPEERDGILRRLAKD